MTLNLYKQKYHFYLIKQDQTYSVNKSRSAERIKKGRLSYIETVGRLTQNKIKSFEN